MKFRILGTILVIVILCAVYVIFGLGGQSTNNASEQTVELAP